ncbi:hypothetical protein CVT24_009010 [Panaeolus cyanescens]|uniref:Uncharacterized protein n=1 Tax=Panaeolus cyanescens TaxID=181874 RepID=A0A409YAM3_9AGAR|nr:hypothetical protein CVT24_009010 [Panaeolus cyanescens]
MTSISRPCSSSSSSTGILQRPLSSPPHSPRRIRFAPLPDPRRSVLVTEDGQELPIPDDNQFPSSLSTIQDTSASEFQSSSSSSSSTTPSATSTPNTITPASSVRSSPVSQNTALPLPKNIDDSSLNNNNQPPPSAWPRSLFLLRPFKRTSTSSSGSSSHSLTPTPSIEQARSSSKRPLSTEEILTLGTINLFRTASRDSSRGKEKENDAGWGLSRWSSASATPTSIDRGALLSGSSPLARTQSAGSYSSKSKKSKKGIGISLFSSSSTCSLSSDATAAAPSSSDVKRPNPRPTTTPAKASKYKGTRMLNGRVYGAPKNHQLKANPFATARDNEPEFVEWGYGGMGSVKGAKSAGVVAANGVNWARLSGGSVLKDSNSDDSRPSSGAADRDDDDEDGSGMGWVRRRREERERKKKEQEDAAVAALTVPEPNSQETTPTPTRSSTLDAAAFEAELVSTPRPTAEDNDVTPMTAPHPSPLIPTKPVHITEAITIPVHKPHHHHHRSHSHGHGRTKSKEGLEITIDEPIDDAVPTTAMSSESAMVTPTPANLNPSAAPITTRPRSDSTASTDTSASETDSDSENEDPNTPGEADEDEDEEDEGELERRKTALGAGVEKINTSASETDSDSENEDPNTPGEADEDEDEEDEGELERRKTALGAGVEKISRHGSSGHA